jgi:hypothetical protein
MAAIRLMQIHAQEDSTARKANWFHPAELVLSECADRVNPPAYGGWSFKRRLTQAGAIIGCD